MQLDFLVANESFQEFLDAEGVKVWDRDINDLILLEETLPIGKDIPSEAHLKIASGWKPITLKITIR